MHSDLLARRRNHFVLWRPAFTDPAPALVIGALSDTGPIDLRTIPLAPLDDRPDLWGISARTCGLQDETAYCYWFQVRDSDPYLDQSRLCLCTDPFATAVDRRFPAPEVEGVAGGQPAAILFYRDGSLLPCDGDGRVVDGAEYPDMTCLPANNRLVLYELPTRWAHPRTLGSATIGDGTFRDVQSLLTARAVESPALGDKSYLEALGVNALELLPPADSTSQLGWGYGTANFFAADYYLGHPDPARPPTASADLVGVANTAHRLGIRLFCDMVMAFARACPLRNVNFSDFFVQHGSDDPEAGNRESFGGDLFKLNYWVEGYDPISGDQGSFVPARAFLQLYLEWWLTYYRVDGLRLDSVNNIANEQFLEEFTHRARDLWRDLEGVDDRFLVVGEELSVPVAMVGDRRLDGLWNETFKHIARRVILGQAWDGAADFGESVRKLIDCRLLGFSDASQAVNYLTSHDIGELGNERLYEWLRNNGVAEAEDRVKLAFVCLLTAVGIPMILAGDEFAEEQDLDITETARSVMNKEVDPVRFDRLGDEWRWRIFTCVCRLVRLRTGSRALDVNDVSFIHEDVAEERRVMAWQRGTDEHLVVVVANFSDYGTPDSDGSPGEYVIPGWPEPAAGAQWYEVCEDRPVPQERLGREPLQPWTARVYARRAR